MLAKRDEKRDTLLRTSATPIRALAAIALMLAATGAHAESVFKCSDAHGVVAFQATPCASSARQKMVDVREQPLIDPDVPASASGSAIASAKPEHRGPHPRMRRARESVHQRKPKPAMSFECRASDGEVFYRHARCPYSIAGDGIARSGDDAHTLTRREQGRARNAWASLAVTAYRVTRSEACRQINAVAAIDRDGSQHDEQVSVYDHNKGRDPCLGF